MHVNIMMIIASILALCFMIGMAGCNNDRSFRQCVYGFYACLFVAFASAIMGI